MSTQSDRGSKFDDVRQISMKQIHKVSNAGDFTPASIPQEVMQHLVTKYPQFYTTLPWVAKTVEFSVKPGARGCSPRIVKACGGSKSSVSLQFGRCMDSGTSFSAGMSAEVFERIVNTLSQCHTWTAVRNWEPVDDFTFLCKLPSLGDSCVTMRNTYPSCRTKIETKHFRRSIESERLLMCGFVNTSATCSYEDVAASVRASAQAYEDSLHKVARNTAPANGCAHPQIMTQNNTLVSLFDAHAAVSMIDDNANATAAASHVKEHQKVHDSSNAAKIANASLSPDTACDAPLQKQVRALSKQREREIRAAATATITKLLLLRTAEVALRDPCPFDMRVRVERDIAVSYRSLRDLMEPTRSELSLQKTFFYGDPMSVSAPAWAYEIKLSWTARGMTQAERMQRTCPPRCTVNIQILNASEMILAGEKTPLQIASMLLLKAVELQHASQKAATPTASSILVQKNSSSTALQVLDAHEVYGRVESAYCA